MFLSGGNTDSLFDIQSKTGVISLAGNLDFESKVAHTFYIRASDRGRPSRWSTCTVIVSVLPENEFVPIFKETEIVVIAEDTPIGNHKTIPMKNFGSQQNVTFIGLTLIIMFAISICITGN